MSKHGNDLKSCNRDLHLVSGDRKVLYLMVYCKASLEIAGSWLLPLRLQNIQIGSKGYLRIWNILLKVSFKFDSGQKDTLYGKLSMIGFL